MADRTILIKKYENRRLYDTVNSRYVNLEDVAKLLQEGATVRVVDAASGEDITRLILTQIIVEDAKAPDSIFPVEVLRQMVLASSQATQQGAVRYMQAMMDMYQRSFQAVSSGFPWAGSVRTDVGGSPVPGVWPRGPAADQSAAKDKQADGDARATDGAGEMEQLRSRLAELEATVSRLKSTPDPQRPGAPNHTRK